MKHTRLLFLVLSLVTVTLSGCLGDDDSPPPATTDDDPAPDAAPTDTTGSIVGQVVTQALEPVQGAGVGLVNEAGEIAHDTQTDANGKFTFNGVEPGTYKVQVAAICCNPSVQKTTVSAGETVDVGIQLTELSANDLQQPYAVEDEWNGFISCGVGAAGGGLNVCGLPGVVHEAIEDPNDEFLHVFNVSKGLKTLILAVEWDAIGGVLGSDLAFLVEDWEACSGLDCPAYTYAEAEGTSPLYVRLDNPDITSESWKWDNITDERVITLRMFPSGDANAMYQQPFTVYISEFYWEEAPEDYDPIPDQ